MPDRQGYCYIFYVMQYLFITSEVVLMNYILRELQSEI
ncbi:putative membrane protein [Escherichia coli 2-177-06_S3_C2]|nr:putative membrane protein [Escherichia coli 2-011-08_S1_C1]KDX42983.1 putative membrane protein [Escherichia coli 2-177-06_S3_C2]KEO16486.1 putative membrane protein [Escherichia coli 2-177-06_S3_C3]